MTFEEYPSADQKTLRRLHMNHIERQLERQRQIESDSVRDGCVRWCQNTEYQQATDTKPYRNLIRISWRSLADAIRAAQDSLKTSKKTKLPAYGLPLSSIGHEQMALITLGTLFNMIARSEFETCLPPRITPVAYDIGQRCRIERLALTEAAETWIGEQTPETLDLFNPIYVPMIVEPRPWTSLSEGGYLVTPMKLFKRQTGKRAQQRLEKADLSAVCAAVNALQNTPYRINQAVYQFQRDAWIAGLPFFGLEREDQLKGLQKMMAFRFGQAVWLSAEEKFYFPCQVDHRGRVYPVPPLINPQSDHIGRAPIEFADGKLLGKRGAYWLAIHLANCYWKKKKVSFKKRLAWVHENEEEILDFAANPLRIHRFWTEADQPWL